MDVQDTVRGEGDHPPHGSYARTRAPYFCHCPEACQPYRRTLGRYERQRKREAMWGTPRMVDAAPTIEILRKLHAAGAAYTEIAKQAGVSKTAVAKILSGTRAKILRSTAERIAAVDVAAARRESGKLYVPAVGSARKARALAAMGHSFKDIAREAGMAYQHLSELVNGHTTYIRQETADALGRVYDAWSMRFGGNVGNRRRAIAEGWPPPLSWEGLDINDPKTRPRR